MAVYGRYLALAPGDSTPGQETALPGEIPSIEAGHVHVGGLRSCTRENNCNGSPDHGESTQRSLSHRHSVELISVGASTRELSPAAHTGDAGDKSMESQNSLKPGESEIIGISSSSSRAERWRGSSHTCDDLEARPDAGSVHKKRSLSERCAAVRMLWREKLWKPSVYLVTIGMLAALLAGLSLPWSAITAAVGMMLLDFSDAGPSLEKVTYTLLVFFSGMFIATSGFNATGAPEEFWLAVEPHSRIDSASGVSVLSLVVTVLSNVVSNVPTVILLGSRVAQSAASSGLSSDKAWLILAWVSTVAGNLTLVGSAANLIVSEQARPTPVDKVRREEQPKGLQGPGRATYNLNFWNHIKFGFPSTLIVTAVGLLPLVFRKF